MAQAVMTEHEGNPVLVVKFSSVEEVVEMTRKMGALQGIDSTYSVWSQLNKWVKEQDDVPF